MTLLTLPISKSKPGRGFIKANDKNTSRITPAVNPQTRLSAERVISVKIIVTAASRLKIDNLKKNSLLNSRFFWNFTSAGLMKPRKNGTKEIRIRSRLDSGEPKNEEISCAPARRTALIITPRKIETIQVVLTYSFIFLSS